MKFKGLLLASLAIVAAMVVFAFVVSAWLPAGAELPVHWNATGTADRYAPAFEALIFMPLITLAVSLLFALIPYLEPLQDQLEGSEPFLKATWIGTLVVMLAVEAAIGLPAFGIAVPVNIVMLAIGLMLLVIGNAMPKSRPGFFIGIRTPWTISDTDIWIATHRLGAKLTIVAAIAIIAGAVMAVSPQTLAIIVVATLSIATIVPVGYSWWLWRSRRKA